MVEATSAPGGDAPVDHTASPHISPAFVARAVRGRAQWGFRPEGRGARTQQYVEHPEARKHRWVRCIAGRSRKLVRNAG